METVVTLSYKEMKCIEEKLEHYDNQYVPNDQPHVFQFGIKKNDTVVAGLFASMNAFKIVYVSIVFVEKTYRLKGYGKLLMQTLEKEAKKKGAKYIRLDTFDFQGRLFYKTLGYEEIGQYESRDPVFSEHFFLKRL